MVRLQMMQRSREFTFDTKVPNRKVRFRIIFMQILPMAGVGSNCVSVVNRYSCHTCEYWNNKYKYPVLSIENKESNYVDIHREISRWPWFQLKLKIIESSFVRSRLHGNFWVDQNFMLKSVDRWQEKYSGGFESNI